jgi:hypothetical protein
VGPRAGLDGCEKSLEEVRPQILKRSRKAWLSKYSYHDTVNAIDKIIFY